MPDPSTHFFFGGKVLESLPPAVQAHIELGVFQRAVQGPDPWSTCGFWDGKTKQFAVRSGLMHKQKTGDFLRALLREAKAEQTAETFSLLAGFICHYCLDKTAHPYIVAFGGEYDGTEKTYSQRGGHVRLERAIDSYFIRKECKKAPWRFSLAKNIFCPSRYPDSLRAPLDRAFREVYDWEEGFDRFNQALKHERLFYALMQDPFGLVQLLLRPLSHGANNYCLYSYYRREIDPAKLDFLNEKHAPWRHPFAPDQISTDSFHQLFEKAKKEAEEMILAAFEVIFREKEPEDGLFGEESYSTGLPWMDGRNQSPPVCQPLSYYNYYKNHQ